MWIWLPIIALAGLAIFSAQLRVAAIVGIGVLFIIAFIRRWSRIKRLNTAEEEMLGAADAYIGRKHDNQWLTRYKKGAWRLVVWLPERKFYFTPTQTPFDPSRFYGEDRIREWSVHRNREVSDNTYWNSYAVNIIVKDTETPLLKIYCGNDEATAYKIYENLNQMFEGVTGAVGSAKPA